LESIGNQKALGEVKVGYFLLAFGGGSGLDFYLVGGRLVDEVRGQRAYLSLEVNGPTALLILVVLHYHNWITLHIYTIINPPSSLNSAYGQNSGLTLCPLLLAANI
jgi:hypothetical protein